MRETKEALENVSVSLQVLQEATGKLDLNLSLVRANIKRSLNDPGCHDEESDATSAQLCRGIRQSLEQLHISANFTRVPDTQAWNRFTYNVSPQLFHILKFLHEKKKFNY